MRGDVQLRQALQLYVNAAKLHLRLDNALDVESARAHAQDALENVSRASDPRAQVASADAARDPCVPRLGVGREPESGRRGDLGLHRRRPRRPRERAGRVRPRAAAAARRRTRHARSSRGRAAASAGRGTAARAAVSPGAATDDVPHAARLARRAARAARRSRRRRLRSRRTSSVRRSLGLPPPERRAELLPSLPRGRRHRPPRARCGAAGADPHVEPAASRRDVQALFVLDTSRSMAASSTPTSPTRLDRAAAAAVRLRAAIPQVESGVAHAHRPRASRSPPGGRPGGIRRSRPACGSHREPAAARHERAGDDLRRARRHPREQRLRAVGLAPDRDPAHRRREQSASRPATSPSGSHPARVTGSSRSASGGRTSPSTTRTARRRRPTAPTPPGAATLRELASALGGRSFEESQVGAAAAYLRRARRRRSRRFAPRESTAAARRWPRTQPSPARSFSSPRSFFLGDSGRPRYD